MNRLYAKDVVANPFGTATPFLFRVLYISPRDAFFPPAIGTSFIPKSLNGITKEILLNILSPKIDKVFFFISLLPRNYKN